MSNKIFSEEMERVISTQVVDLIKSTLKILTEQEVKQDYFRPDEASKYCGVSVPTLERWEELGLKYSKIRNVKLYTKSNLDAFILLRESKK